MAPFGWGTFLLPWPIRKMSTIAVRLRVVPELRHRHHDSSPENLTTFTQSHLTGLSQLSAGSFP
jgi:hypothetical protein